MEEVGGATCPIRYGYDTAGRQTLLATTRDGINWDDTRRTYDVETGFNTSKIYADGSTVSYTYTADGKPLRTTFARGEWKENAYNTQGWLASVFYSSEDTPGYEIAYDVFGMPVSVLAADGVSYAYAYNAHSVLTNETIVTEVTNVLTRAHDDYGRETSVSLSIDGTRKGVMAYSYNSQGRLAGVSLMNAQNRSIEVVYTNYAGYAYGWLATLPNASVYEWLLTRDRYRRSLVTSITNRFDGFVCGKNYVYRHDALGRPVVRNDDQFTYNPRSELASAFIGSHQFGALYDEAGNRISATNSQEVLTYSANQLNQYTTIDSSALTYDADGNLISDGIRTYAYDCENRLVEVTRLSNTNDSYRITNRYDYKSRRIGKLVESWNGKEWQIARTHTFIYDGWNLIHETITEASGTSREIQYFWGKDLSETLQGAGGVGGLLAVSVDGMFYLPCYDSNGNIVAYLDENGNTVASYTYDAFGATIEATGEMADVFPHRFSTKYYDSEIEFYYYGYRFYSPALSRWLNRDPIEENGGENLYGFLKNNPLDAVDLLGQNRYMTTFSFDPRKDQWHIGVAVDTWKCENGKWKKTGVVTFDYGVDDSKWWYRAGTFVDVAKGGISESSGLTLVEPHTISSMPKQDIEMLRRIRKEKEAPPLYNFFFNNCIHWATKVIDYGMDK